MRRRLPHVSSFEEYTAEESYSSLLYRVKNSKILAQSLLLS
jgi:hypothetical protein